MLVVAEAVRIAAEARRESRGAHQRDDHPFEDSAFRRNTLVSRDLDGVLGLTWRQVQRLPSAEKARGSSVDGAEVSA